jgi:hypothetical protein
MLGVKLVIDISKVNILWFVCAVQSICVCVCVCVCARARACVCVCVMGDFK